MGNTSKTFALILILIIVISCVSLLAIKPAYAQSIPTPSVPEFTLKVVAYPYYVAPITTIDPYTGQNVTTQAGYYVQNMSIVVTIRNQPFSYSYNGTTYSLYYDVRMKGHFGQDWTDLYPATELGYAYVGDSLYVPNNAPLESNSDYTVLSYLLGANGEYPFTQISSNSQVDFQVETVIGHDSTVFIPDVYDNEPLYYAGNWVSVIAFDTSSSWSNTVTITVVNGASGSSTSQSTTPNPTATPTLTSMPPQNSTATVTPQNPIVGVQTKTGAGVNWIEVGLFIALAGIVALVVVVVAMTVRHRKTANSKLWMQSPKN